MKNKKWFLMFAVMLLITTAVIAAPPGPEYFQGGLKQQLIEIWNEVKSWLY